MLKLTLLLTHSHLRALYKTLNNKQELIDTSGTISKTLFGTMDADDVRVTDDN